MNKVKNFINQIMNTLNELNKMKNFIDQVMNKLNKMNKTTVIALAIFVVIALVLTTCSGL